MEERLQKYLAECGIASRRKCEELIKAGFVSVNNQIVRDMGIKIDTDRDIVKYRDKVVKKVEKVIYIMLNKPVGYVTTTKEQFERRKVTDLLGGVESRVYPVGRLDYNTSGLLLLTNDGNMAYKLTHPSHEIDKTYVVEVRGVPTEENLETLRNGVDIGGFVTSPAEVIMVSSKGGVSKLKTVIHEGKNRQVRRMFSAIGYEVIKLKRTALGNLKLGDLKVGEWRYLKGEEVQYLKEL